MTWTRLTPLPGKPNPCACCPPIPRRLHPEALIATGFGEAYVECDGVLVVDGDALWSRGYQLTLREVEHLLCANDPDHDWRIVYNHPLHGETYQRQDGEWALVAKNGGFA